MNSSLPGSTPLWVNRVERTLRPVFVGLAALATLAGSAIVILLGTSVVMRHVAGAPLRFTEELVGLLVTAAFFLALPLVTLNADHVHVRLVVGALPPNLARWAQFLAGVFGVIFCLWFAYLCLPWFEFAFERQIKSEVSRLLLFPWMALMPVSIALTSIAIAIRAVSASGKAGSL